MDDFLLFSAKDRQDISYVACVGGTTLTGLAVGRFGMLPGLLAGGVAGLAMGLLSCRLLAPAIEKKLFDPAERLSEQELSSVLKVIRDQTGVRDKSDAMYLLALVRHGNAGEKGGRSAAPAVSPRAAAAALLSRRA